MFTRKLLYKYYKEDNDNEIDDLKNEIIELNIRLKNIMKENNKNICSICYENKINICCIPCGHTYCDICISNSDNCYSCRSHIVRINKIFI